MEAIDTNPLDIDLQNWERLQELFHLASCAPQEQREQVLADACPDPGLRERALALLLASSAEPEPHDEDTPRDVNGKIGPYHLLRHLGTGGIGSVYLAERIVAGSPQRFAIKVLSQHAAGNHFVERFHREQHILASLDHPNITRLADAGLSDAGLPYLVMEYVNGTHLDVHCDAQKLEVAQRLQLFLKVCEAVAYAHRNLIVHLDLKPSNILVTQEGVVKLLDFGTSKLIQPDSQLTTTIMATPAYASPEQLRNEAVTTACDVYSLGAVLFVLLSGSRPGGKASVAIMIERAMREQEPDRLPDAVTEQAADARSTTTARLTNTLKGDLATITSKCLRARPQDRYLSVDALADDIRRYLAGRTVLATPHTVAYRLRKFVRRNRKAVLATATACLLLTASLSYAAYREKQALREAQRAVEMQAFMMQLFKLASTNYTGKPAATVPEFLRLGSTVLPQMIKNPADERAGEISLAQSMFYDEDLADADRVLRRVIAEAKASGDIPSEAEASAWASITAYKLGDIPAFTAFSTRALELADKPGVTPTVRVWIKTFHSLGRYEIGFGDNTDIAIQRSAMLEAEKPGIPYGEVASAKLVYALVGSKTNPPAEQQKYAQQAVDIYRSQPYTVCETAQAERILSYLQTQTQGLSVGFATMQSAYQGFKQCRGEDSEDALETLSEIGAMLNTAGRPAEAIPVLESDLAKLSTRLGPNNVNLRRPLSSLATSYILTGHFKQAQDTAAQFCHVIEGKTNSQSSVMGLCNMLMARALQGQGRYAEALRYAQIADQQYHAQDTKDKGLVASAQRAHQLVIALQAKVSGPPK